MDAKEEERRWNEETERLARPPRHHVQLRRFLQLRLRGALGGHRLQHGTALCRIRNKPGESAALARCAPRP